MPTVNAVLVAAGFVRVAETPDGTIFECPTDGGEPHWIIVDLADSTPIEEDDLIEALQDAGVARDAAIDALHQCGY